MGKKLYPWKVVFSSVHDRSEGHFFRQSESDRTHRDLSDSIIRIDHFLLQPINKIHLLGFNKTKNFSHFSPITDDYRTLGIGVRIK